MVRAAAYLYAGAGVLGLIAGLAVPRAPGASDLGTLVIGIVTLATAVGLLALLDRVPMWGIYAITALGSVLVTLAIHFDGQGGSAYALVYLWSAVFAFYFLPWLHAVALMLFGSACYATLLALEPGVAPIERWLLTFGTIAMLGTIIGLLRRRMQRLFARLSDAARTDPLTGLLNRRGFEAAFGVELERARRGGHSLSVLVGDLDRFKEVNDRLGHSTGDAVLIQATEALDETKRRIDTVARIGGEEFAIIMPESDQRAAYVAAERLRNGLRARLGSQQVPLTISFGIAAFPDHGETAEEILHAADRSLYAAKELGRDRSVIHSDEVDDILAGEASWRLSHGRAHLATVLSLAEALDIRDTGTGSHSQTVGRYAEAMARELGLPAQRVERVRLAGILHDVGKIGVSDAILHKSGPLTEHEQAEMRKHPAIGARLIGGSDLEDVRGWVIAHHERPDGRGFPRGLRGEEIPLESRIVAVADAYEAMTADRSYRKAMPPEDAQRELRRASGSMFDERVVKAFLQILRSQAEALVRG